MRTRLVGADDGTRIAVRDVGAGAPVLLIHGWGLSSEVWDRQIHLLARAGRRVLAMDQRGHGDSDAPFGDYGIERLAADAAAVLLDAGAGPENRATVVGWSIGGLVGLRLAHDRPELVDHLVLVASQGVAGARHPAFPFGVPASAVQQHLVDAERADRIAHRRRTVLGQFAVAPDQATADWLHRICLQLPSWAGDAAMATLLHTEQVALADDLSAQITQIVGSADPVLDLEGARWLHQRWGSTLVELDCGHYPMLELADEFDDALVTAVGGVRVAAANSPTAT